DFAKAALTVQLIQSGVPMIEQAVLWNPQRKTYGIPDLLVRADILNELFPETIPSDVARADAEAASKGLWHYRVVDVKFRTLDLLADGHASAELRAQMAQVWIYNEALAKAQRYLAPSSFLLGRGW